MPKNNRSVVYELDLGNLPPLSESQKQELEALRQSSDNKMDYSDIRALDDDFWEKAMPLRKSRKTIE